MVVWNGMVIVYVGTRTYSYAENVSPLLLFVPLFLFSLRHVRFHVCSESIKSGAVENFALEGGVSIRHFREKRA